MFRRLQPVRGKRTLDVAIGSDRFVRAVTGFPAFELINVLADQVTLDSVPSDKGQTFLQNLEFTEGRKFVDHGQEFVFVGGLRMAVFKLHFISQTLQPHSFQDEPKEGTKWGFDYDLSRDHPDSASRVWPVPARCPLAAPKTALGRF